MPRKAQPPETPPALRIRALARLTGSRGADATRASSAHALRVLYELASSPSTSADALVLLHELQVYQVELELQDEEMRHARAELEAALALRVARSELAPFGYCTVDAGTVLHEINPAGARLLGADRPALMGRPLDAFLAPDSALALRAMLTRIRRGATSQSGVLQLRLGDGAVRVLHAALGPDLSDDRFLLAFFVAGAAAVSGI
jgi:PAS domain-containing protein